LYMEVFLFGLDFRGRVRLRPPAGGFAPRTPQNI
jgi:hypothetical protein